jgi:hypothetical protein
MAQLHLKRAWAAPPAGLDEQQFHGLWQQQRVEEVRAAILGGHFPPTSDGDNSGDDEGGDSDSPSGASSMRSPGALRRQDAAAAADAAADAEFESALQAAADEQLGAIMGQLQAAQAGAMEAKRQQAQVLEEECAVVSRQQADLQARLDALKHNRHELVQQLKLVRVRGKRVTPTLQRLLTVCAFNCVLSLPHRLRRRRQQPHNSSSSNSSRSCSSSSSNGSGSRCRHRQACPTTSSSSSSSSSSNNTRRSKLPPLQPRPMPRAVLQAATCSSSQLGLVAS